MSDPLTTPVHQAFLATHLDYDQNEVTEAWEVFDSRTGRVVARVNSEQEAEDYLIRAELQQSKEAN